jgi:hypothetical protein
MFEQLKGFLLPFITSKIMQLISGALLTLGLSSDGKYSIEEIIAAVIVFGIGWLISLFTHKKALNTTPPAVVK